MVLSNVEKSCITPITDSFTRILSLNLIPVLLQMYYLNVWFCNFCFKISMENLNGNI